jgi:hypothetical protein
MTSENRSKEMGKTHPAVNHPKVRRVLGLRKEREMWSNKIRQVVEVFQEKFHVDQVIEDPVEYVEKYKAYLKAAGPELKFLGLAISDRKSPFGWGPTPLLIGFIAERKVKTRSKPLYEAQLMDQLLTDYVFGYEADRAEGSVCTNWLLEGIGLLHYDGDTYWVTEDLHNLFHNGYFDKRQKEGLSFFPDSWNSRPVRATQTTSVTSLRKRLRR